MPAFGKPNATGRSSGKLTGRAGALARPPQGEPWVWLTSGMLCSPAFQGLGINARRVLDFLLIEHMAHAGRENGRLLAPYSQLVRFGVARSEIAMALEDLAALGLVEWRRGLRIGVERTPSSFRLTWLPTWDGRPPTNDWSAVTEADVETHRIRRAAQLARRRRRSARADGADGPGAPA